MVIFFSEYWFLCIFCTVVVCPSIGSFSLEHGRWRIVNGSHYEYRTKIIFTCDPGYYRLGPAHIQCMANGAWSWRNERPHCQSKCVIRLQSTSCLALLVKCLNRPCLSSLCSHLVWGSGHASQWQENWNSDLLWGHSHIYMWQWVYAGGIYCERVSIFWSVEWNGDALLG